MGEKKKLQRALLKQNQEQACVFRGGTGRTRKNVKGGGEETQCSEDCCCQRRGWNHPRTGGGSGWVGYGTIPKGKEENSGGGWWSVVRSPGSGALRQWETRTTVKKGGRNRGKRG